jgi:hypothetical protein
MTNKQKKALFQLPYFKQGDDMCNSLVKTNGKNDPIKSINNHIYMLEESIKLLKELKDNISPNGNFSIDGDGHTICVTGDEKAINTLLEKRIIYNSDGEEDSEEEKDEETNEDNEEDDPDYQVTNEEEDEEEEDGIEEEIVPKKQTWVKKNK